VSESPEPRRTVSRDAEVLTLSACASIIREGMYWCSNSGEGHGSMGVEE